MLPKGHGKENGEVRDVTIPFRRLNWLCPRGQRRFTLEQRQSLMSEATSRLSEIQPDAAGIDVGADYHWVSIPEGRDSIRWLTDTNLFTVVFCGFYGSVIR